MVVSNPPKNLEMRDVFGQTLVELGGTYPKMLVLDADLHTSSKAEYFKKAFPTRFFQFGIAEQNMFAAAAGLATQGFIPFPSTFASFVARRALDQLAISICYPSLNVKIPGSYVGIPTSRAGATHNCVEDLAIMRVLPHMRVAAPGDNQDLMAIMRTAIDTEGPVYFRVVRYTLPKIFDHDHKFEWGKGVVLREGTDVTLFGTGMMTSFCMEAADILAQESISAEVVHLASIKPIDTDLINESVAKTGCAVTAENASIIGGFGAAVAEALCEGVPVPMKRVGVPDEWVCSGGVTELLNEFKMQPADICSAARNVMERKGNRSWI